jgi:hypothetical protein
MSVEIESLSYHHLPRLSQTLDISDLELEVAVLPFRYNPLHDVESIWWIGVWLLFCHRDTATTVETSLEDAQAQLLHVQKLFPRVLKSRNFNHETVSSLAFPSSRNLFVDQRSS